MAANADNLGLGRWDDPATLARTVDDAAVDVSAPPPFGSWLPRPQADVTSANVRCSSHRPVLAHFVCCAE